MVECSHFMHTSTSEPSHAILLDIRKYGFKVQYRWVVQGLLGQ